MVATQQSNLVGITKLEGIKRGDDFEREHASVYIVSEEDKVEVSDFAYQVQHLYQIEKLTVDITHKDDRVRDVNYIFFLLENVEGHSEQLHCGFFRQSTIFLVIFHHALPVDQETRGRSKNVLATQRPMGRKRHRLYYSVAQRV